VRYYITHQTSYEYHEAVSVSHHLGRLRPRESAFQSTLEFSLTSDPRSAVLNSYEDYFGNTVSFITIEGPHRQLMIASRCRVDVKEKPLPRSAETPHWESVRAHCRGDVYETCGEACEFSFPSTFTPIRPEFLDYASPSFTTGRPVLEAGIDLMQRIHSDFKFDRTATTVATPLEQVLRQRRGVCQDFAHLQIACFRAVGLPARYISGYLETVPPQGQPKLVGADASHAWVQLWCDEAGWIDLDPTNNLLPAERHITLAWGRDFGDVSPLRGVLVGSGNHQLKVAVDVNQVPDNEPAIT
jgi:transglutaminase-like putative cysteine protease